MSALRKLRQARLAEKLEQNAANIIATAATAAADNNTIDSDSDTAIINTFQMINPVDEDEDSIDSSDNNNTDSAPIKLSAEARKKAHLQAKRKAKKRAAIEAAAAASAALLADSESDSVNSTTATATAPTTTVDSIPDAEFDSIIAEMKNDNDNNTNTGTVTATATAIATATATSTATSHASNPIITISESTIDWSVLSVNPQYFNSESELKSIQRKRDQQRLRQQQGIQTEQPIINTTATTNTTSSNSSSSSSSSVNNSSINRRSAQLGSLNRLKLIRPTEHFPVLRATDRGLFEFNLIQSTVMGEVFQFTATAEFNRIQLEYNRAINSTDHIPALIEFSRLNPYYPDSCLSLADLSRYQHQLINSHIFIQRALYSYQQSIITSQFNVSTGRMRLDSSILLNLPFLIGLAAHSQYLNQKGAVRTAFEVSKLLLQLSPLIDPQCILLLIDYYSIRSSQLNYLQQLVEQLDQTIVKSMIINNQSHPWIIDNNNRTTAASSSVPSSTASVRSSSSDPVRPPLCILPNIMFGLALAKWINERHKAKSAAKKAENKQTESDNDNKTPAASAATISPPYKGIITLPQLPFNHSVTPINAFSENYSNLSSSQLLQRALMLFPEAVELLLKKPQSQPNDSSNTSTNNSNIIRQLTSRLGYHKSDLVDRLLLIFTTRSGELYQSPAVQQWIKRESVELINKLTHRIELTNRAVFNTIRLTFYSSIAIIPINIMYLHPNSYTDTVDNTQQPNIINPQQQHQQQQQQQRRLAGGVGVNDPAVAARFVRDYEAQLNANNQQLLNINGNVLLVFLRSLCPWMIPIPIQNQ